MKTLIDASFIIAYKDNDHKILQNGVIVYEDDKIIYVGKSYSGHVDKNINAKGKLVIPGLISMHTHATIPTCERLLPDVGRRDFFGSGVFNCIPVSGKSGGLEEDDVIGVKFAIADALRHGCTTMVEVGRIGSKKLLDIVGESGIRAYVGPGFRSAKWSVTQDGSFEYIWDEDGGYRGLDSAVKFVEKYEDSYDKRIKGMLYPLQADTCTKDLLSETKRRSIDLNVKIQIHAAQNLLDFHETLKRYKKTPIQFLKDSGILDKNLVVAHCIFISGHSWTAYPENSDLQILSKSGTTVAHCPLVYARRGIRLESYQKYQDAGVNIAIGMDTYPRDIISEMRLASLISKIVDQDYSSASSASVFRSATLNSARALGREDIGRLCEGAKADIVIVDLNRLHIGPVLDPIKALVNCATGLDVDTVIIDGKEIVKTGALINLDEEKLLEDVNKVTQKSWRNIPNWHWDGKTAREICTSSFFDWES